MTNITKNNKLNLWIQEIADKTMPDKIVLVDGSDKQTAMLKELANGATNFYSGKVMYVVPYLNGNDKGVLITQKISAVLDTIEKHSVNKTALESIENSGCFIKNML